MTEVNPLKSCNNITDFNQFTKNLEVDVNGHRFTYEDSNGKMHSYTLNQIAYQFNKCKNRDESALTKELVNNPEMKMKHWENLGKNVNKGLDRIDELAKRITPSWKTPIKNALFAITHKGFNREAKIQKIQKTFPKNLTMVVEKIGRNLPSDSSFADLEAKFKSEGYSLERLILSYDLEFFINTPVGEMLFKEAKADGLPSPMNEIIKNAHLDFKVKEILRFYLRSDSPKPHYRAQVFALLEESLEKDGYSFSELLNQASFVEMLRNSKLKEELASRLNE